LLHLVVFQEVVTIKEGVMEDFEKNVKMFATEHLHTEKEARFIIEGSGMSTYSNFFEVSTIPLYH
jgi:cupin superfamily acireductone dioxygenase involved in methionine salvage